MGFKRFLVLPDSLSTFFVVDLFCQFAVQPIFGIQRFSQRDFTSGIRTLIALDLCHHHHLALLWVLLGNCFHDLGQLPKHAASDCVLEHFNSFLSFLLKMLSSDSGNMLLDTLGHEILFSHHLEHIWVYLHQRSSLLAIFGERTVGIEDQGVLGLHIK